MSIRCDISSSQVEAVVSAELIEPAMRDDAAEVVMGLIRVVDCLMQSNKPAGDANIDLIFGLTLLSQSIRKVY
jgi:hypothetical protein